MTAKNVSDTNEMAGLIFVEADHCYWFRNSLADRWVHLPESMTDDIAQQPNLLDLAKGMIARGFAVTGSMLLQQLGA